MTHQLLKYTGNQLASVCTSHEDSRPRSLDRHNFGLFAVVCYGRMCHVLRVEFESWLALAMALLYLLANSHFHYSMVGFRQGSNLSSICSVHGLGSNALM